MITKVKVGAVVPKATMVTCFKFMVDVEFH
jgi:hypothetical protein